MFQLITALILGKAIYHITRILNIGGGSTAPGYYALRICPNLVEKLIFQIPQNILITGTNGKTTTSRLLNHLVKSQNLKTLRNSAGSNLERGIASSLISKSNFLGQIKNIDLGIWEVDEAAFNTVLFKLRPQIIVFLNAFRDQLDRYGEVDSVVRQWRESLRNSDWNPYLIINGSDYNTLKLSKLSFKKTIFGIPELGHIGEKVIDNMNRKINFDILARNIKPRGLDGIMFDLISDHKLSVNLPTPGIYHIFDFLAAFSVYNYLDLPTKGIEGSLRNYSPAFGRVEKFTMQPERLQAKVTGYFFLIKNPAGTNLVLETIKDELQSNDRILLVLNDNLADGTDVSWIWDGQFEILNVKGKKLKIICSGTRAEDMALRLKYAGLDTDYITLETNLKKALLEGLENLRGRLFILPTYTALLGLQKLLAKMGVKKHYWKEEA